MSRTSLIFVLLVLCFQVRGIAADLIQLVPVKDPAFAQLRVLDKYGMLATPRDNLFPVNAAQPITRYDIAFALIEPLQRVIALTDASQLKKHSLEQHRRRGLALQIVSGLTSAEFEQLTTAIRQLLQNYGDVVDELAPGLSAQATGALRKIHRPSAGSAYTDDEERLTWSISIDPKAEPDPIGKPLPLYPINRNDAVALPFTISRAGNENWVGVRAVNSMEAAVDVAFGGFRLYGTVSTLPGQDPAALIRPQQLSGSAMLGLQVNLGAINDLGISGILEYHILRSNEPAAPAPTTNIGAVGGVGIVW